VGFAVRLRFARKQGGLVLPITIETDVEDTVDGKRKRSPKAALEFMECMTEYLKDLPI
jgi:hypothetical protein